MPLPYENESIVMAASGITVFGVALGLHPEHLVAGFCGAMWSLLLCEPMPALRRISIAAISTFVAGYLTPAVAAVASSFESIPRALTVEIVQYPVAVLIGFSTHWAGPVILRFALRKTEQ